ncbi:MAG: hypothetical protein JST78_08945 [Bacteroidetes bacterium]|nr:hypothetical protein [Bacteroidota bacterium]
MKIDFKGKPEPNSPIQNLIDFIQETKAEQLWSYMGLTTVIDPTVDYQSHNLLVRWLDIHEGFNDKIIVNSLDEFNMHFKPVN